MVWKGTDGGKVFVGVLFYYPLELDERAGSCNHIYIIHLVDILVLIWPSCLSPYITFLVRRDVAVEDQKHTRPETHNLQIQDNKVEFVNS